MSTHADIEKISLIPQEREVLFFPFSSFEIESVVPNEEEGYYVISLLYLGKYLKKIEADPNLKEKTNALPETEFSKEFYESQLIEKEGEPSNPKSLIKKFNDNKNNLSTRNSPLYHKAPIYSVSQLTQTPKFNEAYSISHNNYISTEFIKPDLKPYIIRRIDINGDGEEIYDPQNFGENYIIGYFKITENDINKNIRIINSFEQIIMKFHYMKVDNELRYSNEKELIDKCKIKIDDQEFKFNYFFIFQTPKIYKIEYFFNSNLTKADFLFAECSNLINLDLFHFNCKDVTNMVSMFSGCVNLEEIRMPKSGTRKVEDMNSMFYGCQNLKNLDLSFFNTQKVVNMSRLFFGCKSLSSINLSRFNTQNVVNMYGMFEGCSSLQNLRFLNFYTQNVINMNRMFFSCSSLKALDLSSFNTSKVAYMNSMFCGCSSLQILDISNFNIDNVINMEEMFTGCSALIIEKINFKDKGNLIKRSRFYERYY